MRARLSLIALMLTILFCAVPALALFGPPSETFKGRVNFLQPTNFTLITEGSQLVRIMVAQDRSVPPEVQLGVVVEVKAVKGKDGLWYLDKFKAIELTPQPSNSR